MTPRVSLLAAGLGAALLSVVPTTEGAGPEGGRIYQLRTYHTAPGKLPVLLERFGTHNLPLFERHGITLVGAWTPADAGQADRLVYLVSFPDRAAADAAWAAFAADPQWKEVSGAEKEQHGTVVERAETVYLAPTDYSPTPRPLPGEAADEGHLYELRTYITPPGKLDALNARFRNHTVALFRKHRLESVLYTTPIEEAQGAENTLIYFLQTPGREAAEASWAAFRGDPEWQRAKAASEQEGPLTSSVASLFLTPTAFSPLK